jgi:pyruvate formate lyase activating enzyme
MWNRLVVTASPSKVAEAARRLGCRSVAFTYNEPVTWAEYVIDTAECCRAQGLKTIAVTAGYIQAAARPAFFRGLDAVNVDLKGFSESFYRRLTGVHLQPVLETLLWIRQETDVWLEITTLIIPGENDARDDIQRMASWIVEQLGRDVPLHFTQFHPDHRMLDRPPTPPATLIDARELAMRCGLRYVYTGNVADPDRQSTYCPACGRLLIERNVYRLGAYDIRGSQCRHCRQRIPGHFEDRVWQPPDGPPAPKSRSLPPVPHSREFQPPGGSQA